MEPHFVTFAEFEAAVATCPKYFEGMGRMDMEVRGCTDTSECRFLYTEAFIADIPPLVQAKLVELARRADDACARSMDATIRKLLSIRWRFALLQPTVHAEGGFPHTHGDVICLPLTIVDGRDRDVIETLVHEKVHVFQRMFARETDAYVARDGYEKVGADEKVNTTDAETRSNPDLDGNLYARRGRRCATMSVFAGRSLSSVERVCAREDGGQSDDVVDEYEHPYERMAYELAAAAVA